MRRRNQGDVLSCAAGAAASHGPGARLSPPTSVQRSALRVRHVQRASKARAHPLRTVVEGNARPSCTSRIGRAVRPAPPAHYPTRYDEEGIGSTEQAVSDGPLARREFDVLVAAVFRNVARHVIESPGVGSESSDRRMENPRIVPLAWFRRLRGLSFGQTGGFRIGTPSAVTRSIHAKNSSARR